MNETNPDEACDQIWHDDRLNRRADAEFLLAFLLGKLEDREQSDQPKSYVLNLDAQWGEGKSFFLERMAEMVQHHGYLVASVNAWQDDHADDPLLAVMAGIEAAVEPWTKKNSSTTKSWKGLKRTVSTVAMAAAKGAANQMLRKAIGDGVDEIAAVLGSDPASKAVGAAGEASKDELKSLLDSGAKSLLDQFNDEKRSIANFKKELANFLSLAPKHGMLLPLFVFVDELDRCRPSYAIALLERIKHLFDIDNVIFVVATDTQQLRHAVCAVYGNGFDSVRYLFRFFDRTYRFEPIDRSYFVSELIAQLTAYQKKLAVPAEQSIGTFAAGAFQFFGVSLRDIEQCLDLLLSIVIAWEGPVPLELAFALPLVIAQQQGIPAARSAAFSQQLRALHEDKGDPHAWRISFAHADHFGRPSQSQNVSGYDLFEAFRKGIERSLPQCLERTVENPADRWIYSRFQEEFMKAHRNAFRGEGPMSKLTEYPVMVRSAGRLKPKFP